MQIKDTNLSLLSKADKPVRFRSGSLCRYGDRAAGLTLIEVMIMVVMISMLIIIAQVNLMELYKKNTFKGQIHELVSTMEKAVRSAAESDKRYEVILDMSEQWYILREITTTDLDQVLEEEIIVENSLSDNCHVVYVLFDDYEFSDTSYTNEGQAKFRAGRSGWQYGGKIVLVDSDERVFSIVVNRLNRTVELREGDVEILVPKADYEVVF